MLARIEVWLRLLFGSGFLSLRFFQGIFLLGPPITSCADIPVPGRGDGGRYYIERARGRGDKRVWIDEVCKDESCMHTQIMPTDEQTATPKAQPEKPFPSTQDKAPVSFLPSSLPSFTNDSLPQAGTNEECSRSRGSECGLAESVGG